jgi:hypothetical protein
MPWPADPRREVDPAPAPAAVPGASELRFDAVAIDGGTTAPQGPRGLAVRFDHRGMEISATEPQWLQLVPWPEIRAVTVGAEQPGRSGGVVVPVEVASGGRTVRLLIGSGRPQVAIAALEAWLAAWSASAAIPPEMPPPMAAPQHDAARYAHRARRVGRPRRRRWATLVAGLVLVCAGVGLAVGLAVRGHPTPPSASRVVPGPSADQRLADQAVLTRGDLPPGWRTESAGDGVATSGQWQRSEASITQTFARCVGVSTRQATVMLGGQGADQTAKASSPVFEAPTSPAAPGVSVGLETAAATVRSHRDEESDFSRYANPDYPECAAAAIASELQLGADQASGTHDLPGPATATVETLPAPPGEQLNDLIVSFDVTDQIGGGRTGPVPTEVELVSLGSARLEAELEAFAIGGRIPTATLAGSLSTFERRVATAGRAATI